MASDINTLKVVKLNPNKLAFVKVNLNLIHNKKRFPTATTELELMLCLGNNILTRQTHLFNIKAALGDFSDTDI